MADASLTVIQGLVAEFERRDAALFADLQTGHTKAFGDALAAKREIKEFPDIQRSTQPAISLGD